jgi:hypothetical protein
MQFYLSSKSSKLLSAPSHTLASLPCSLSTYIHTYIHACNTYIIHTYTHATLNEPLTSTRNSTNFAFEIKPNKHIQSDTYIHTYIHTYINVFYIHTYSTYIYYKKKR